VGFAAKIKAFAVRKRLQPKTFAASFTNERRFSGLCVDASHPSSIVYEQTTNPFIESRMFYAVLFYSTNWKEEEINIVPSSITPMHFKAARYGQRHIPLDVALLSGPGCS